MGEGKKKAKKRHFKSLVKGLTPIFAYHCIGDRKPGNRHITTCMLLDENFNVVSKGVAFRAPMDQPCSKEGRNFALSRAKGALTFMAEEAAMRAQGDDTDITVSLSPVRRSSVRVIIGNAKVSTAAVEHKVMFRPMFFTEEEKYVLERFIGARKRELNGEEREDTEGKGTRTEKTIGVPRSTGHKYRIRRDELDHSSAKRESA